MSTSDETNAELFRILTYLVGSASNARQENPALAAFRMLDASSRLINMADRSGVLEADGFLLRVREQFGEHFGDVMWDLDRFWDWLSSLEREFVREARSRNLAADPEPPAVAP